MKKIVLTVVAVLGMTTATYAEKMNNEMASDVEKTYDMTIDLRRLGCVLGLNDTQMNYLRLIHINFCNDMAEAALATSNDRKELATKAINKDATDVKYVLNAKQYDKYMTLLNCTLANKGIEY